MREGHIQYLGVGMQKQLEIGKWCHSTDGQTGSVSYDYALNS